MRPRPMRERAAASVTLKASGVVRGTTDDPGDAGLRTLAREVGGARGEAPLQDLHQLVPVGVEQQATLLQDDARVVAARVEPHPAQVCTHRFIPCPVMSTVSCPFRSLVTSREEAGLEAEPQVLVEPDREVRLALRRVERCVTPISLSSSAPRRIARVRAGAQLQVAGSPNRIDVNRGLVARCSCGGSSGRARSGTAGRCATPSGTNEYRTQPTCWRSAHTAAGRGSPVGERGDEQGVRGVERRAADAADDRATR